MTKRTRQNVRRLRDERDASGQLVGESVEIDDLDHDGHKVRVFRRASLLRRLHDAKRISDSERAAGERFESQFEVAGLGPRYGSIQPDAIIVDGGRQWAEPMGGSAIARAEIDAALAHVGEFAADCLAWLLGHGEALEAYARRCRANGRFIEERALQFVLIAALGALDSFYRNERRHGEGR